MLKNTILTVVSLAALACVVVRTASATDKPARNLLTNGGFEKSLLVWESRGGGGGTVDESTVRSGKHSLRVAASGGMRTPLIPYKGGRLQVTGWMKTERIVSGKVDYHRAALQLISYDREKRVVGHSDIALVEGTRDWTRYEGTVGPFSREVAFVTVDCHLWGDATGTVWFDDITLIQLDNPSLLRRRPINLSKADVTIRFDKDLGEFRQLWLGSDVCWVDRVITPTQVNAIRAARQAGFRYVRLHGCIGNSDIYSEDANGKPQYDWKKFDLFIDAVVQKGMLPVVVIEGTPLALTEKNNPINTKPPRDAEAYLKWQSVVREMVGHCRKRWGAAIRDWYFEVWNEPDAFEYFQGSLDDYLRIYDHAVAGATAADSEIRIGGPGLAGVTGEDSVWCRRFLEHCSSGKNDATGGVGCRVDFFSWHIYTIGVGIPAIDTLDLSLGAVRRILDRYPAYRDLPLLITEWGCSSCVYPGHDRPYDAAFRTMAVGKFMDAGITLALPFALGEGPYHAHDGFMGGLALFTKTTIPKPSFRAFELLHRMVGTRVACESTTDSVGGLACVAPDRKKAWIMLYNLVERADSKPYTTQVRIRLSGLPHGRWSCSAVGIAPSQCDPFVAWEKMGRPETLTETQRQLLLKAAEMPHAQALALANNMVQLAMPGFSVMFLELQQ